MDIRNRHRDGNPGKLMAVRRSVWSLAPVLLAVVFVSCTKKSTVEPTEKTSSKVAETTEAADPTWPGMDDAQKKSFMKKVVMPKMKALFSYNADFGCMDCHGENAQAVSFSMPNTIAPLDPSKLGFQSDDEMTRNIAKRMSEVITPEMAKLLSTDPYDQKTKKGFGCFGCHAMAGAN